MSFIKTLLENEEVQGFLSENAEAVDSMDKAINDFPKILKSFVLSHPNEFIAEDIENTKKNIRVFSEIATSQYIHEVSNIYGALLSEQEQVVAGSKSEYI